MGPSTTLEVQGSLDSKGYFVSAKGMVPMERLLAFGRATGFRSQVVEYNRIRVGGLEREWAVGKLYCAKASRNSAPAKSGGMDSRRQRPARDVGS